MDAHLVNDAIVRAMASHFEWGTDDCCTFVCDLILADTGKDFMAPLRGRYDSEAGANIALGGGGLAETALALAKRAGLKPALYPWSGDLIGVVAAANGPMLALLFEGAWLVRTLNGSARLPMRSGVMAWSFK